MRFLGKSKLVRDVSANTAQAVVTQIFGLLIFYLTSRYLGKNEFGELNWSLAVGSTAIALASLGLDLVYVRKIAAGENVVVMSGIHFFHTLAAGIVLCGLSLLLSYAYPSFGENHPLFFFIILNLVIANIGNSFKLCLNGLEAYSKLAVLAVFTNAIKLSAMIFLYVKAEFTFLNVVLVLVFTSGLELLAGYFTLNRTIKTRVKPLVKVMEYKYFVLESLPQLGVVLFDSALARVDWILLGIISSAAITADYSFTYKVFELSKLPLLIIAPVLLTRFSRILRQGGMHVRPHHVERSRMFLQLEMYALMIIPVFLVMCWTPLVDYFTSGKYGAVNEKVYWILAICIPLSGLVNFLWTLGFAQGQLRTIMLITIAASVVNVAANLVLIPLYAAYGAAFSYLLSTALQLILYLLFIRTGPMTLHPRDLLMPVVAALTAILCGKFAGNNVIFATLVALVVYIAAGLLTGLVRPKVVMGFLRED